MRLKLRSFLLTSALTFLPSLASATTISGIYVDGGAGYNLVQDQHVHADSGGLAIPKFTVNHGTGFTGFGAIGYGFGNGLRVEAEGLYNFSHDNYTDDTNEAGPTSRIASSTYRLPKGDIHEESCSTFFAPGVTAGDVWGKGPPEIVNGDSATDTVTPSNKWYYIPANKCFVFEGPNAQQDFNTLDYSPASVSNTFNGYPEVNGYNPIPGTYSVSATGNQSGVTTMSGINVFPGHPLYSTGHHILYIQRGIMARMSHGVVLRMCCMTLTLNGFLGLSRLSPLS